MVSEVIMASTNAFLFDENENILNLTYDLSSDDNLFYLAADNDMGQFNSIQVVLLSFLLVVNKF